MARSNKNEKDSSPKASKPKSHVRTFPREVKLSDAIEWIPLAALQPAKINDLVYKPISLSDPAIIELGRDILAKGLLEAIVVTKDNVVVSGHRRRGGCMSAGLETVPIRRIDLWSGSPRFEEFLTSFNQQRVKSIDEQIREEVIRTSPEDAHNTLLAFRKLEAKRALGQAEEAGLRILEPGAARHRAEISDAKQPMLEAAITVIEKYRDYWPLTLRQIHYRLLGQKVLRHAKKPASIYVNTQQCYKDLSGLLSRARLAGLVPWESMHDPTRPRTSWQQWDDVGVYLRERLDSFLCDYKRNLLQSQPAYIELIVEKITVQEIAERAAMQYHVPVGVGRGYTSVTSLEETARRFRASGKSRFILLIAGDFDPEGENICETWGACLRDEHDIEDITLIKVAVNPEQIEEFGLSPLPVKDTSSRASGFIEFHGDGAYELEAFEPDQLQQILRDAIRSVLDLKLFVKEQRKESEDARRLMAYRNLVREQLKNVRMD